MATFLIDGLALPAGVRVLRKTLGINQEIGTRAVLKFTIVDLTGSYRPLAGQPIEVYDGLELIFSGFVDEPQERRINGTFGLEQEIICVDNNYIADRRVVAESFDRMKAGDIARWIVTNVLADEGVTVGNIQDGLEVGPVVSPHLYASQLLNELIELIGFEWRINFDKTLDFYSPATGIATPVNKSDILANDVVVWRDRSEYRNRQILTNVVSYTSEQEQELVTDGVVQTFLLRFPLDRKPKVFVNDVQVAESDIGILGLDENKKWYWNRAVDKLTQSQDEIPLLATDKLEIKYFGQYKTTVILDNPEAIEERKAVEGGTGIYEAVEEATNIDSVQAADEKAIALLRKYARIAKKVKVPSEKVAFRVGELKTLNLPEHGISGDYLVMSIAISDRDRGDNKLLYTATLVDGEPIGGWVKFFRNWLERSTRSYTIRENEVVRLLARVVESDIQQVDDELDTFLAYPPFQFKDEVSGAYFFLATSEAFGYELIEGLAWDTQRVNCIMWGRWQWLD